MNLDEAREVLGVPFDVTKKDVERAYRLKIKPVHPDVLGDKVSKETEIQFERVKAARARIMAALGTDTEMAVRSAVEEEKLKAEKKHELVKCMMYVPLDDEMMKNGGEVRFKAHYLGPCVACNGTRIRNIANQLLDCIFCRGKKMIRGSRGKHIKCNICRGSGVAMTMRNCCNSCKGSGDSEKVAHMSCEVPRLCHDQQVLGETKLPGRSLLLLAKRRSAIPDQKPAKHVKMAVTEREHEDHAEEDALEEAV